MGVAQGRFKLAMRVLCCAVLAILLALSPLLLCSCDEAETKTHVTVSVWDSSLLSNGFSSYIEEQNPDYDIEWIVGQDSLDHYVYQAEQGSLPDVILTRDFDRASASQLSSSLYDLSSTEVAQGYSSQVLSQVPGNSDAVKFLPGAAGFEGIIINNYLFELYNIPVPTDSESFINACNEFSQRGVRPFVAGMADSEVCYKVMQGFADATLVSETENFLAQLTQGDGTSVSVDSTAFDSALTYAASLVEEGVLQADDMSMTTKDAEDQFLQGNAAMMFFSGGKASSYGEEHNMTVRALPFFGGTSEWAFAEPSFMGMVSDVKTEGVKTTASDETIHAAAIDVLSSIMSTDAQNYYLELVGVDKLVPTSEADQVTLPDALSSLELCLQEGSVRSYLPNKLAADVVGTTFQKVLSGALDSSKALEAAESQLASEQAKDEQVLASFSEGVSNLFDSSKGNVAASDIAQVAASALNTDVFVSSSRTVRCPLYAGDKTATALRYPVAETSVYAAELFGAQLKAYLAECVAAAKSPYELPVASGVLMSVAGEPGSYSLEAVQLVTSSGPEESGQDTVAANDGQEQTAQIEDEQTYKVGISAYNWEVVCAQSGGYGFTELDRTLQGVWVSAFRSGKVSALPAYQGYLAFV